jgi:hypothetical protein
MAFAQDILTRIIDMHVKEKEPPPAEAEWRMICKTGPAGDDGKPDDIVGVEDGSDNPTLTCGDFIHEAGVNAGDPIDPMANILWYISPGFNPQIREVWVREPPDAGDPVDPRQESPPLKPPDAGIPPVV